MESCKQRVRTRSSVITTAHRAGQKRTLTGQQLHPLELGLLNISAVPPPAQRIVDHAAEVALNHAHHLQGFKCKEAHRVRCEGGDERRQGVAESAKRPLVAPFSIKKPLQKLGGNARRRHSAAALLREAKQRWPPRDERVRAQGLHGDGALEVPVVLEGPLVCAEERLDVCGGWGGYSSVRVGCGGARPSRPASAGEKVKSSPIDRSAWCDPTPPRAGAGRTSATRAAGGARRSGLSPWLPCCIIRPRHPPPQAPKEA